MTHGSDGVWTLLTGHGHVLVAIAKNPRSRVSDLSREAGLTERTTLGIINDLESAGYISRHRTGRRTTYTVHRDRGFRHSSQEGLVVGPLLEVLAQTSEEDPAPRSEESGPA
ncbi:DNA-binding IclR family transcriptional regulator [Catenulispora sp. EB89]|uniref:helix-turn-helix transcriptional regulator n=1 Tax=Catenulispora sp. EB89 TaxID=3156257 RepID=UPI0035111192